MSDLTIRDARVDEHEVIRELTVAAYTEYAAAMGDHWDDYRAGLLNRLGGTVADRIVAARGDALVGSVLLNPAGSSAPAPDGSILHFNEPEFGLLSVPPERRGQGIARALMTECARRARAAGSDVLALHTMEMMTSAMALYETLGFARDPEHDFSPAPNTVVRSYRLDLTGA